MIIHHYWSWSDGSHSPARTLAEAQYSGARPVPALVVRSFPALAGEEVRLEFRSSEGWELESSAITDSAGTARLRPYPRCESDQWCRGPLDYRIVAGNETTVVTITYLPREGSAL